MGRRSLSIGLSIRLSTRAAPAAVHSLVDHHGRHVDGSSGNVDRTAGHRAPRAATTGLGAILAQSTQIRLHRCGIDEAIAGGARIDHVPRLARHLNPCCMGSQALFKRMNIRCSKCILALQIAHPATITPTCTSGPTRNVRWDFNARLPVDWTWRTDRRG